VIPGPAFRRLDGMSHRASTCRADFQRLFTDSPEGPPGNDPAPKWTNTAIHHVARGMLRRIVFAAQSSGGRSPSQVLRRSLM